MNIAARRVSIDMNRDDGARAGLKYKVFSKTQHKPQVDHIYQCQAQKHTMWLVSGYLVLFIT